MNISTRDGELRVGDWLLLPALENSEYLANTDHIKKNIFRGKKDGRKLFGHEFYVEIEVPVMVKRTYKLSKEQVRDVVQPR